MRLSRDLESGHNEWGEWREPELVERARHDRDAFAELYRRYHPRVFAYLLTYAATVEDAADLSQHVFLRAFEALPSYRERGIPFSAWLFRIARNAAMDAYRRQRRVLPWDHLPENILPISAQNVEAETVRMEDLNQMRVLIAKLDPDKQELLALRFASRSRRQDAD